MILVDAGPLVALVDASDRRHRRCVEALKGIAEPLGTVWAVVAEAVDRLAGLAAGQEAVLEMIERRSVAILEISVDDVARMRELRRRHGRRRLSFADLGLLRAAEAHGIGSLFTLEGARFRTLRIHGRKRLRIVAGA